MKRNECWKETQTVDHQISGSDSDVGSHWGGRPALQTKTSIPPKFCSASSTKFWTAEESVTSKALARVCRLGFMALHNAIVEFSSSCSRAQTVSDAADACVRKRAIARPIPRPAPVTRTF